MSNRSVFGRKSDHSSAVNRKLIRQKAMINTGRQRQNSFLRFISNTASNLWLIDSRSGNEDVLSPKNEQPEYYDYPLFSKDGKGVYVVTDHDSDMRRVAYIELANRKISYMPSNPKWDVDEFQLAPDGKTLAYITNEDGISCLHLFDITAGKERPTPQVPVGIISDLKWHRNSTDFSFLPQIVTCAK